MSYLISVLGGLAGAASLSIVFAVIRARWPHGYYAVGDLASFRISLKPHRYILFRFLPVLLVTVFVATTVDRAGGNLFLAAAVLAVFHLIATAGRATVSLIRHPIFAKQVQMMVHLFVSLGVLVAALAGTLCTRVDWIRGIVPRIETLPLSLWTAAFAAFVGAFLVRFVNRSSPELQELLKQSRSTIPEDVWEEAGKTARREGTDEFLVKSVLLVENLQRPVWIRRLERIKGRLFRSGTYGIMQIKASGPIGDIESVRLAVKQRLSGIQIPQGYEELEAGLSQVLSSYNPDEKFVELGKAFYLELAPQPEYQEKWSEDLFAEIQYMLVPAGTGVLLGSLSTAVMFLARRRRRR
jgi:hypothetical protein